MAEGVQKIRAWFAAPMPPASPPDPQRGDGLRDASMPRTPSNLASSLDEAPMVVYDITREGQTGWAATTERAGECVPGEGTQSIYSLGSHMLRRLTATIAAT
eukprot:1152842-Pelagomonas_calceolata.AAC.12